MNVDERNMIAALFERLRGAESAYRDPEAEDFIARQVIQQPHAPYAMAQTLIVQQQALDAAKARIETLQADLEEARNSGRGGSFLPSASPSPWGPRASEAMGAPSAYGQSQQGGMFGRQGYEPSQPYGAPPSYAQPASGGGGFLSGALQTAAGVAGGALLFEGVRSLFGGGEAHAASGEASRFADATPQSDDAPAAGGQEGGWFSGLLDGVGSEPKPDQADLDDGDTPNNNDNDSGWL